ncbi:MAG: FAD:protein FMN transferase [Ruminococcus sp.]|nr:FAD:protein FMN transferase [Ruminococcus sp.]
MKKFAAALICGALLLTGCSSENKEKASQEAHSRDIFAMDTFMTLKAYGDSAEEALSEAAVKITDLEKLLAVTDPESDISRINSSSGEFVQVSEDTAAIIGAGIEYGDLTGGALDITVYPVLREWGFTTGEYRVPSTQEIGALLENVDYTKVEFSGDSVKIPGGAMVDTGSLAKGYTSDRVIEILRENDVNSAIVSLGGNVQSLGLKPDGSQWKVGIKDPFQPDSEMCIVSVGEKAVITSGNYERFFVGEDGEVYWHIIDPADGAPADNGLVSVTVIGDSGLMCDALSTALFVSGTDKAQQIWRSEKSFDMVLVTDDERILVTEGIADSVSNISDMDMEVLTLD